MVRGGEEPLSVNHLPPQCRRVVVIREGRCRKFSSRAPVPTRCARVAVEIPLDSDIPGEIFLVAAERELAEEAD